MVQTVPRLQACFAAMRTRLKSPGKVVYDGFIALWIFVGHMGIAAPVPLPLHHMSTARVPIPHRLLPLPGL